MNALEEAKKKVEARYAPKGNVHLDPLEHRFISVSRLTSMSAEDMVWEILKMGDPNDVSPYWAFKGNTLGDQALADVAHKEIHFEHPLGLGWVLSGNCDGIEAIGKEVVVYEHKAYGMPSSDKIEKAKRQAMLYLAMAWATHARLGVAKAGPDVMEYVWGKPTVAPNGDTVFRPADYKPDAPNFTWPKDAQPAGVVLCIAPNHPPAEVLPFDCGPDECMEVLNFYVAKALVVLNAVLVGKPDFARDMWDRKPELGGTEFAVAFEDIGKALPEVEVAADAYLKANWAFTDAKIARDEAQAILLAALDKQGVKKVEGESFKATVVEVSEKYIPEHVEPATTRKGYRFVKITGDYREGKHD